MSHPRVYVHICTIQGSIAERGQHVGPVAPCLVSLLSMQVLRLTESALAIARLPDA